MIGKIIKNFKAPQKMRFRFFGGKTEKYPAEYIETENIEDLHEIFDYLMERHTWVSVWEKTGCTSSTTSK